MSDGKYFETTGLLKKLQMEMQASGIWSAEKPEAQTFSSTAPFCCDSMSFENWLQYVFIPKMRELIVKGQVLPEQIALLPMAEESLKPMARFFTVFDAIQALDSFLDRSHR